MKNTLTSLLATLFLSGCSIGAGQNDFNCSSGEGGAVCGSSRSIYELTDVELNTNQSVVVFEDGEKKAYTVSELKQQGKPAAISEKNQTSAEYSSVPQTFSYDGEVLRREAEVLRIWIAPFIDANDDLHLSKLVYTDITEKAWQIGIQEQNGFGATFQKAGAQSTTEKEGEKKSHKYRPPVPDQNRLEKRFNTQ